MSPDRPKRERPHYHLPYERPTSLFEHNEVSTNFPEAFWSRRNGKFFSQVNNTERGALPASLDPFHYMPMQWGPRLPKVGPRFIHHSGDESDEESMSEYTSASDSGTSQPAQKPTSTSTSTDKLYLRDPNPSSSSMGAKAEATIDTHNTESVGSIHVVNYWHHLLYFPWCPP